MTHYITTNKIYDTYIKIVLMNYYITVNIRRHIKNGMNASVNGFDLNRMEWSAYSPRKKFSTSLFLIFKVCQNSDGMLNLMKSLKKLTNYEMFQIGA